MTETIKAHERFIEGERVQMHPATDTWMMGDRYGEVLRVTATRVHVRLDISGRTIRCHPSNVLRTY